MLILSKTCKLQLEVRIITVDKNVKQLYIFQFGFNSEIKIKETVDIHLVSILCEIK